MDWNATHFFLPPSQLLLVAVLPLNRTDLYQLLMPSSASRYQSQNVTVFITLMFKEYKTVFITTVDYVAIFTLHYCMVQMFSSV